MNIHGKIHQNSHSLSVFDKSPYLVIMTNTDGEIFYANEAWHGYISDEFLSRDLWHWVHPHSKMLCMDHFASAKEGDHFELQIIFTKENQSLIYTEGKFNCAWDHVSEQLVIIGIIEDMTSEAERELEILNLKNNMDLQSRYWKLLHQTFLNLMESDPLRFQDDVERVLGTFGRIVYADRAFIVEYDLERLTLSNTYEWCEKGITPKKEHLQQVPFTLNAPFYVKHLLGEPTYVENVSALEDDEPVKRLLEPFDVMSMISYPMRSDGKLFGFVGFDSVKILRTNAVFETQILSELCDVFLTAIHRNRMLEMKFERELRFNRYIQEAPLGIFVCGTDLRIHEVNTAFIKLTGYDSQELLGRDLLSVIIDGASLSQFANNKASETLKSTYSLKLNSGHVVEVTIASARVGELEIINFCFETTL